MAFPPSDPPLAPHDSWGVGLEVTMTNPYYNACNLDLLVYLYLCISICVFVFSRLIHNGASRFLEGGFGGDRPNISRAECNFGLPGNQGWVLGTLSLDWYLNLI